MTPDEQYEMRRETLVPVAIHNLRVRYKTDRFTTAALLDEIDELYDQMYRPHQAEVRKLIKEHIRSLAKNLQMPTRMNLIREQLH